MTTAQRGWFRTSCWLAAVVLCLPWNASVRGEDAWDAVYRGDSKIGHIHTFIEPVTDKGHKLLRVRLDTEMNFRRGKDVISIKLRYGTIETPDGSVLKLDHRMLASTQEMRTHGDVIDGKMLLRLEGGGQVVEQSIPWGPDVRGPYAPEQSLARKPMKVGESREIKMYIPELNAICDITLTAKQLEEIMLGDGKKRPLLRVEQTTKLKGENRPEYNTTLWADETGQILKSFQDVLGGLVVYRTTKEGANAADDGVRVDSIIQSVIKVTSKISNSVKRTNIRFRISQPAESLAEIVPSDRRQTLEPSADKATAVLDVRTAGPEDGEPGPEKVGVEFERPNALITSADRLVKALAREAIAGSTEPWDKAVKIERWVAKNIKDKNFSTAFAPASEVARTLSGDCTEHSVLAAAMCRAEGIPARVVVGLIYVDHQGGFGFHMWHEVYVNRRWVALDSSWDQSAVDATHIKLSDTSLDGVSPYQAFLPVVRVMGKMTIEPVEIR